MRGNLSIIFGEDNNLYLHLKEQVLISEIDRYTSKLINSDDIRRDFASKINEFVLLHKDELERLGDKRGRVVICYQDLKNSDRIYRLRVLYQKNRNKLNMDYVLGRIIDLLKKEKNPILSSDVIKGNLFLFETDFAKHKIKDAEEKILSVREKTRLNNILVDYVIESTLSNLKIKDYEKAYFAVRKLDSFLERKKGYVTTAVLPTTVKVNIDSKKSIDTSTRLKDRLLEQEYFDREDIEYYQVSTNFEPEKKENKPEVMLTRDEFTKKRIEEANLIGERLSFSDIDTEYQDYIKDYQGNKFR